MPASIEPLRQLARDLYLASDLPIADVARALRLTTRRVNRWSSRDGGWAAQRFRFHFQRRSAAAATNSGPVARRAVANLQRAGLTREEAARALFAQVAALVLEESHEEHQDQRRERPGA